MASWCLELAQVQRLWGWGARNNYRFLKHQALPDTSTHCSLWELNGEAERPSGSPLSRGESPPRPVGTETPSFPNRSCLALSPDITDFSFRALPLRILFNVQI